MDIIAAHGTSFIAIAVIFALFLTWGIGANDVANAMGAFMPVDKALKFRRRGGVVRSVNNRFTATTDRLIS